METFEATYKDINGQIIIGEVEADNWEKAYKKAQDILNDRQSYVFLIAVDPK